MDCIGMDFNRCINGIAVLAKHSKVNFRMGSLCYFSASGLHHWRIHY